MFFFREALRFSLQSLRANPHRTLLTALGLMIGNASVIQVVTISLTSREYILDQIRGIGSNLISASYEAGSQTAAKVEADFVKLADQKAVVERFGQRITAATSVMTNYDRIVLEGREQDIAVIGTDEQYRLVRNIAVLAGRFLDRTDIELRLKVVLLTEKLALRLYGGQAAAVGAMLKLHGLQFTIIGTFKERTETFGLSELSSEVVIIPITVIRYFNPVEQVDPLYVQARRAEDVEALTVEIRKLIESRHRPGAKYRVQNLNAILDAAKNIALVLTLMLILISAVTLVVSGTGIMNIMLVTVTERTPEIGLRMAVGAPRKAVLQQFLMEAVLISLGGGLIGILMGVAIPLGARYFFPSVLIPISSTSILVAFAASVLVGLVFGFLPASRAARLNPTEALRHE